MEFKGNDNLFFLSDSYKITHWGMYPEDTQIVYSYFESRAGAKYNKLVFFGLQYLLKKYLSGSVISKENLEEARLCMERHLYSGALNEKDFRYIIDKHGGRLPLKICAVPEGSAVEVSNVMMTVENTDPNLPWLTNFVESLLLHVWHPSTVATTSCEVKKMFKTYASWTCENDFCVDYQLHDFGFRGAASVEAAAIAGAAHLLSFKGTDTLSSLKFPRQWYNEPDKFCPGFSVNATEHSIMTSEGEEGEVRLIGRLLDKYPLGPISLVSDSYDYRKFIEKLALFKDKIKKRRGKILVRPDSGNPVATAVDNLEIMGKYFGYEINCKGYKVLPPYLGAIWGDGLDYNLIRNILHALKNAGWASCNYVFGMGGGLHQKIDRDTMNSAFKCSAQLRSGKWIDVFKTPLDSSKASKSGRLILTRDSKGVYQTRRYCEGGNNPPNELVEVFRNGEIIKEYTYSEVRDNLWPSDEG